MTKMGERVGCGEPHCTHCYPPNVGGEYRVYRPPPDYKHGIHLLYDMGMKENEEPPGIGETPILIQAKEGASSDLFKGKQKLAELERLSRVAYDHIKNQKKTMESMMSSLPSAKEDLMKGSFTKLNQVIDEWNSNLGKDRIYIEPFKVEPKISSEAKKDVATTDDILLKLIENYNLLLDDVDCCVEPDFIQALYKDSESNKLVVDVRHDKEQEAWLFLRKLPNYSRYQQYLVVDESDPSEYLMPCVERPRPDDNATLLIGNGSYIAAVNESEEYLQSLLDNTSLRSCSDLFPGYKIEPGGTLTCVSQYNEDFYGMTAQHVLDVNVSSAVNNKHIISEVQYNSREMHVADIIHLSSSHFGKLGIWEDTDRSKKAVDIALMQITQRNLDTSLLHPIRVLTKNRIEALLPNDRTLIGKEVTKIGAITGKTTGKITDDTCRIEIYPGMKSEMFAVRGLDCTFATHGDSGALVTMEIEGHAGAKEEFALGIVSQGKNMPRYNNLALCVRLEYCLKALESEETPSLLHGLELYKGFLKPAVSITNRKQPHL